MNSTQVQNMLESFVHTQSTLRSMEEQFFHEIEQKFVNKTVLFSDGKEGIITSLYQNREFDSLQFLVQIEDCHYDMIYDGDDFVKFI